MQKKLLALAGAAVILAFGACQWEIPRAIELRAKPQLDLPVDSSKASLNKMLFDNIKNAMESSEGITVLDYVGHKLPDGKDVQTFLIDYSIQPLGEELSPGFSDLLNKISGQHIPGIDGITFDIYEGSFPDDATDPIDLSNLNEFLNGFEFTDIESYLYISGPDVLLNDLHLKLSVEYTKDDGTDGSYELHEGKPKKSAPLNLDPTDSGKYSDALPANGTLINLQTALNDRPKDLRIKYTIGIDELIDLEDHVDINNTLKIDMLIVLPLALKAGGEGATISLSDMIPKDDKDDADPVEEKDAKDILGRKKSGDGSWFEYIISLSLQLDLSNTVFEGGYIFLDDTDGSVGRKIKFPLIGNGLGISIKGEDLEYINDTVPWDPDIGIYFEPGEELLIPPNLGAVRLKFDADIRARIDLTGNSK